ncbi:hypothetical protein [Arcanobacterium canis]
MTLEFPKVRDKKTGKQRTFLERWKLADAGVALETGRGFYLATHAVAATSVAGSRSSLRSEEVHGKASN